MPSIDVSTTLFSNESDFKPRSSTVDAGGSVTLVSSGTSEKIKVYTYMKNSSRQWVLTRVFTKDHDPPYNAHPAPGHTFTLLSTISGKVLISLSATPPAEGADDPDTGGANGTINVGGGGDPDPK